MSNSSYIIRNYHPADFNHYVLLNIEAEKLEPAGRCTSTQAIGENLDRPNHSPEQDLFIAEIGGAMVGYIDVIPELTIGRVILNCWVHPKHRKTGVATKLFGYATERARELGASAVHVHVTKDNEAAKSTLSKLGFECVRCFLELRLDMNEARWQDIDEAALGCRHLHPGEEDKLTQTQNRSFAGSWGYNLNTIEEMVYLTNLSNRSPEDVLLIYDEGIVTGYCWTEIARERESDTGERKGRIYMLGVDPDYRDKGVGKRVLLAGLAHLRSKGLRVAELTVDSENKAACQLYRSIGFEVWTSGLWYEKIIN